MQDKIKHPSELEVQNLIKLYQDDQLDEAEKISLLLTKKFPLYLLAWKVLGIILKKKGRIEEALIINQKTVEINPKDVEAVYNLGNTFKELNRLEEARANYKIVIKLQPEHFGAYNNLGIVLKELGQFEDAEISFKHLVKLKPNNVEAINNLGNILKELSKVKEAKKAFQDSIKLKPNYAEAHYNMGIIFEESGELIKAKKKYETVVKLEPSHTRAHYSLSKLKTFDKEDGHFIQMQNLYYDKSLSNEQRSYLCFALAKSLEDMNNFSSSFKYYTEGNKLKKKLLNYSINQDVDHFYKIKNSTISIKKNSLKNLNLSNTLNPIFIIGMPRSGTSLIEQIISSHSKVMGAGELIYVDQLGRNIATEKFPVNTKKLIDFKKKYLEKLKKLSDGKLNVTDKMPLNFMYVGLIYSVFPNAKIIHIKRDFAATCWGCYIKNFNTKALGFSYNLFDLIKYYQLYEELMKFWENHFDRKIYNIKYESLVTNHDEEIRNLIKYLDLEWEEACLSPQNNKRNVSTASVTQIRKKIYQGSSEKWKKFEPFLNNIFKKNI
jgi:tetratricopeptide (TPR) repeat protein